MPAKGLSIPKPNVSSASSERPMESEEWKRRPPYLIQSPEEFGPVKWQAKCQCGQVTYKISREKPLKAKYCHCRGCQVMHGGPMVSHSILPLTVRENTKSQRRYHVHSVGLPSWTKGEMYASFSQKLLSLVIRTKSARGGGRLSHLKILDGKTKWSGMDEESDLVDDYGNKKSE
ncbi:hypothetical protein ACP6JB_003712 [Aspergillus fumigatus]